MSENTNAENYAAVARQAPRFPYWLLLLTGIAVLAASLAVTFISRLEDAYGIGLDIVMVSAFFGGMLLIVLWVGWFMIFSRWKWFLRIAASLLLISLPYAFMKLFRPVNGGDATIERFEPVWVSGPERPAADVVVESLSVDLTTETPEDFPRFLGQNQSGVVTSSLRFDAERFDESELLWKDPVGNAWSAFAVRNGFAVTMEQRETQECVTCYDLEDGELQWMYTHAARHRDVMNLGRVGPRATPTIADGLVYAAGALGNLVCLAGADGSVVWQVDLNSILGLELASATDADGFTVQYEANSSLAWGRSGSPLIVDNLVVVPGGGPAEGKKSTLLAFDRLTGELIWRGGTAMIAYGSPIRATVAGVDQILMIAESEVMGFNPADGQVLWKFPRPGESGSSANTSQVTVVSSDTVLTSKGYPDGGGELIRLQANGGELIPESVWNNLRVLKTKLTSPVVHEGHAYSLSNGFLECARLSDGERIWKRRGRFGHGQLLLVGDQLLVHSEAGRLYLIRPTPDGYEEVSSFPTIEGVCWNTFCVYGDRVLVRSELEAACFRIPVLK